MCLILILPIEVRVFVNTSGYNKDIGRICLIHIAVRS
jgi:hypothetical protein